MDHPQGLNMSGLLLIALIATLVGIAIPGARNAVAKTFLAAMIVPTTTFVSGTLLWAAAAHMGFVNPSNTKAWIWCCAGIGLPLGTAASLWALHDNDSKS
jgi:hypothetical protein